MSEPSPQHLSGGPRAAEILASTVTAFADLAALPSRCHELSDEDLAAGTRVMLGLMQRAEQVSIALTSDAIGRGMIQASTAASTKQWVQRLATGEPLEHLQPVRSESGPLVSYDDAQADLPRGSSSEGAQRLSGSRSARPDSPVVDGSASVVGLVETGAAVGQSSFPRMPGVEGVVAHRIAVLAAQCRVPGNRVVREALSSEVTSPGVARVALAQAETLSTVLPTVDRGELLGFFLMLPVGATSRDARALTQLIIATHGGPEMLDETEPAQQACESVSWRRLPTGLVQLIAELSADHAAQVRRAIEALSAPQAVREGRGQRTDSNAPVVDQGGGNTSDGDTSDGDAGGDAAGGDAAAVDAFGGASDDAGGQDLVGSGNVVGEPDLRSAGKRRADALVELLTIAARAVDEGRAPSVGAARLVVTFDYQALAGALGGNTGAAGRNVGADPPRRHVHAGVTGEGDLLSPGTLRRMACDASVIPMVLGRDGVPLDAGKEERLYTKGLRQAVINRDRECTFPGCDRPPGFCQVHHILPWWCGGRTTLSNGALLCGRHHTIVHDKRLTARVIAGRIEWDMTPGLMPLIPAHHPAA